MPPRKKTCQQKTHHDVQYRVHNNDQLSKSDSGPDILYYAGRHETLVFELLRVCVQQIEDVQVGNVGMRG